jgi:hypothetical protein
MPKQKPLSKQQRNAHKASSLTSSVSKFDTVKGSNARVHVAKRRGDALAARGDALLGAVRHATTRNVFVQSGAATSKKSLFSLADDETVAHAGTLSVRAPGELVHALEDDGDGEGELRSGGFHGNARKGPRQQVQSAMGRAVERGRLIKAAKREMKESMSEHLALLNSRFDAVSQLPAKRKQSTKKSNEDNDDDDDDYMSMLNALRDEPRGRPTMLLASNADDDAPTKKSDKKKKVKFVNEADADVEFATTDAKRLAKANTSLIRINTGDEDDDDNDNDNNNDNNNNNNNHDDGERLIDTDADSSDESDDGEAIAERRKALLKQRGATLVVPASLEEFEALVRGKSPAHTLGECMRIMKCNDRVQLEHFFEVLLAFYCRAAKRRPAPLALLNVLVAPLNVLAISHANVATRACRQLMRNQTPGGALFALERVDTEALAVDDAETADALRRHAIKQFVQLRSQMPTLPQLLVMRLQLELWPASASRHVILTPLSLRLAQAMMLARLKTRGDLYRAFFSIALFKALVRDERRYAAEPVALLTALLTTLLEFDDPNDVDIDRIGIRRTAAPVSPALLRIDDADERASLQPEPLSLPDFVSALDGSDRRGEEGALTAQEQVNCVRHALVELAFFVELYADLVALPEVLQRTMRLLESLPDAPLLPEACVPLAAAVAEALRSATLHVTQTRVPIALQTKLAAKANNAVMSREILVRDGRGDDARERTRKLRKVVRREEKGAMRELRRDAFFMADERHRRWLAEREAIDKREREILGMLARQQGEINILEHIKQGKQARAGVGKDFNAAN